MNCLKSRDCWVNFISHTLFVVWKNWVAIRATGHNYLFGLQNQIIDSISLWKNFCSVNFICKKFTINFSEVLKTFMFQQLFASTQGLAASRVSLTNPFLQKQPWLHMVLQTRGICSRQFSWQLVPHSLNSSFSPHSSARIPWRIASAQQIAKINFIFVLIVNF